MKAIRITSTAILSLVLGIAAPAYAQQEGHGEKDDHQKENKQEQGKPEQKHAQEQGQGDHKQQQPSHGKEQQDHQQQPQQAQRQNGQDQHEQQDQAQGKKKSEEKNQQQQHAQQRQDQNKQQAHDQQQQNQQQAQHTQQGHQPRQVSPEQQRVQQTAWQQHRSERWESDHRSWQQRGGYNGYRIPEDRFRGYFGPNHGFRIYGRPFLVVGGFPRFQYRGYWFSLVDPWPQAWASNWYDTDDVYVSYVDNGYYLFNRSHPDVGIAISISL
jgi:hypothetical protein